MASAPDRCGIFRVRIRREIEIVMYEYRQIIQVMFGLPDITILAVGGAFLLSIVALALWALWWKEVPL
jgi:hypothetical protein